MTVAAVGMAIGLVALVVVVVRVFLALVAKEITGWLPYLSEAIVRAASLRLPRECADRWREEAIEHVRRYSDRPLSGLLHALDAWRSTGALRRELTRTISQERERQRTESSRDLLLVKQQIDLIRSRATQEATQVLRSAHDEADALRRQAEADALRLSFHAERRAHAILEKAEKACAEAAVQDATTEQADQKRPVS
jgi:hypothetical protein